MTKQEIEEALSIIWELEEKKEATRENISREYVKQLGRDLTEELAQEGYILASSKKLVFTPSGKKIAIDVIRMAHSRDYDVAVIFSQDQDLSEVADEVRIIAKEQNRWIKVASAFPVSPAVGKTRGINKTDWIRIDRAIYDSCIDPRDYRSMKT